MEQTSTPRPNISKRRLDHHASDYDGGQLLPAVFTQLFRAFLILLSISSISRVTLFTQLAPFALFYDLDVTPDFSSRLL